MRAHKIKIIVTDDHEVRAKLPSDFPAGSAELIVISETEPTATTTPEQRAREFSVWLEALLRNVPRGPALLENFDRGSLYDD